MDCSHLGPMLLWLTGQGARASCMSVSKVDLLSWSRFGERMSGWRNQHRLFANSWPCPFPTSCELRLANDLLHNSALLLDKGPA